MLSTSSVHLLRSLGIRCLANSAGDSHTHYPISTVTRKSIDDVLEPLQAPTKIKVSDEVQKSQKGGAGCVGFLHFLKRNYSFNRIVKCAFPHSEIIGKQMFTSWPQYQSLVVSRCLLQTPGYEIM
ncbi:unnamed protein product [Wuchereria bancrofti]|uniref:Uncharacterized protein n=1 Tax=Wuchereria bancrofti TaxID=6293 RepID=A0A3P7FH11_WUCBA|nr:unnamed protein product [Wuchereria bancrofti]